MKTADKAAQQRKKAERRRSHINDPAPQKWTLRNMWVIGQHLPIDWGVVVCTIILTLLERFDMLTSFVVMVQKEVADRLTATPGSKIYGAPSVKLAWYGSAERVGNIGRHVFWPAPNVDSALAGFTRVQSHAGPRDPQLRQLTFQLVDAAFSQRRKTLHAALKRMVPDEVFHTAGIDPTRRGETLTIDEFAALATALRQSQHEQGQASS